MRYTLVGPGHVDFDKLRLDPQRVADVAASFQAAVVDVLAGKAFAALEQSGLNTLCVGGGVAANAALRQRLEAEAAQRGVKLYIPPLRLCTDNAVMGAIAVERLRAGLIEDLELDVLAGLQRLPLAAPDVPATGIATHPEAPELASGEHHLQPSRAARSAESELVSGECHLQPSPYLSWATGRSGLILLA